MVEYTCIEYTDMVLVYGEARGNGRAARRLYEERYPNRATPSHTLFSKVVQRLRETGTFTVNRADCGAPRRRRTPNVEEGILHRVEETPSTSTRTIARAMRVPQSIVWEVLHEQQLHPYHLQRIHAMGPADFPLRANFCTWFLHRCVEEPHFPQRILFTDECRFTEDAVFNSRNSHVWDDENPHATHVRGFQERFGINVWAGILNGRLIGPYMLPLRLTGGTYRVFLEEVLGDLLEDVPLDIRRGLWFQHDGAPPHFALDVRNHLNRRFGQRWIGRGGPIPWPPRSPDLNPLDFFLWGHMKSLVYETPVDTVEDLVARVLTAAQEIQQTQGVMERVYQNLIRRYTVCNEVHGRHIEPLL